MSSMSNLFLKPKCPFILTLTLPYQVPKNLSQIFHEINPDVVHISTPGFVGLLGRHLAIKHNKPLAGVYHTNFPAYMKDNIPSFIPAYKSALFFMRFFYRPFSLIFSRSNEYLKHLSEDVHVKDENLTHLISGIDIDIFHPEAKDEKVFDHLPEASYADIKVLYVGRLTKEKNFPFLIKAWKKFHKKMNEKGKNAILICAGEGNALKHKETLKHHHIFLLGRKSKQELAPIYTACDFFVFPSTTDTLGQVVMEALACATPVIVSDEGGPRGIVESSNTPCGLVVSPKNVEHWVRAMEMLFEDKKEREKMGKAGFLMMQERSIQKSFEAYIERHTLLQN